MTDLAHVTLAISVVGWLFRLVVALVGALVVYVIGASMIKKLTVAPPPEPTPEDLRAVNLRYRCIVCGAEVVMTVAADDDPDAPRHCREDMVLVTDAPEP